MFQSVSFGLIERTLCSTSLDVLAIRVNELDGWKDGCEVFANEPTHF